MAKRVNRLEAVRKLFARTSPQNHTRAKLMPKIKAILGRGTSEGHVARYFQLGKESVGK